MIQPPSFIDPEAWAAFHEMRRKIKAPLTPYAERLILRELVRLKSSGEDPQACLDQSIRNGWRDVFPLRDKGVRAAEGGVEATKALLAEMDARPSDPPPPEVRERLQRLRRVA
jgi:hypothetical protein